MKRPFLMTRTMLFLLAVGAAFAALAQVSPPAKPSSPAPEFTEIRAMIPMRDGVKLSTIIFMPKKAIPPLPFLLMRTPYGAPTSPVPLIAEPYQELVEEGYIFVFQDIRGRYASEGAFVMGRPPRDRHDARAIDESTDAYDTVEWLLKNVPGNNGRVGLMGISYGGWLTAMAMLDPHPAVKAVSPQASPAMDVFRGDDFFHNGAFRLSYGFEYAAMMETSKENASFHFDRYDTYEWYLGLGPLSALNEKYLFGKIPTWNNFVAHPTEDNYYQSFAMTPYLSRVTVPTLDVGGWWDQEDFYGPQKIYASLEPHDRQGMNYLVIGPWNHGGWMRSDGSALGKIKFGANTSKYFREKIQATFFAHFLKDKDGWEVKEAMMFETGANAWQAYDAWPPRSLTEERKLYFREDGRLSFEAPAGDDGLSFDSYISDPAHPVPYRPRPIEMTYDRRGSGWGTWLVGDQRFAHLRPDVLSWETAPLAEDMTITGHLLARLFASTSGTDSDWIVKLINVYPEDIPADPTMGGSQLMIANDVFRGRFRKSFEKPEPLVPNQVTDFTIDLLAADHRFLKGHKIMVQVQSTWFPLIDRNPQTFVENIFLAKASDYRPATQRVYRSKAHASHIVLPVRTR